MSQVILQPALQDAFVSSGSPNANCGASTILWVGRFAATSIYRTLIRYDLYPVVGAASITNATLKLYVSFATNPAVIATITPYLITEPWSSTTVTWNNQPAFDTTVAGSSVAVTGVGWYEWDITNIVSEWVSGAIPNLGVVLKSTESTDASTKRMVRSNDIANSALRPILDIQYDNPASFNAFLMGKNIVNLESNVTTGASYASTMGFDTAQETLVTFFVKNTGANSATVKMEISPNNTDYILDGVETVVAPGTMIRLVPQIYAPFTRISYKSTGASSTTLDIFYKAQV